jgi:hypothetical protein
MPSVIFAANRVLAAMEEKSECDETPGEATIHPARRK